jgi:hypothetical protein
MHEQYKNATYSLYTERVRADKRYFHNTKDSGGRRRRRRVYCSYWQCVRIAALRLPRFVLVVDQVVCCLVRKGVKRFSYFFFVCLRIYIHPKGKDVQILNIEIILFESPALESCRKSALIGKITA